jgi:hypothetical protein
VYPALHLQPVEAPLPSSEYEFVGQSPHVFDAAPTVVEYFPASQFVHAAFPEPVLYLPATHFTQSPPSGPVEPVLHLQSAFAPLPSGEYEFVGQSPHVFDAAPTVVEYFPAPQFVQSPAPVDVLYLPATQFPQLPPFGPVVPALQIQCCTAVLPAGEFEFPGQDWHAVLSKAFAPVEPEYFPAGQFVHDTYN